MRNACPKCARPGPIHPPSAAFNNLDTWSGAGSPFSADQNLAAACKDPACKTSPIDQCIALWAYDGLVRKAIVSSKYGTKAALADALGTLLGVRIAERILESAADESGDTADIPDLIIPVPSHFWRRIQRGFGGSRLLAESVQRALRVRSMPIQYCEGLRTTRRISKQAFLGGKAREANVAGAFRVKPRRFPRLARCQMAEKHILLVDDVMTTGATARENARVLKAAGARRVTVVVVARAAPG